MDLHRQLAAWIAIVSGALGLFGVAFVFLVFGGIAAVISLNPFVTGFLATLGMVAVAGTVLYALANVIGGIAYLRTGSGIGKVWLIISNALLLFAFPIGSAFGFYGLWAILREVPQDKQGANGRGQGGTVIDV